MHSVLIVDDHDIVRFALETLVTACPQLQHVASAGTLAEALRLIVQYQPHLVITDLALPDSTGLATLRTILAAQHERCTLVVSMHNEMLYGEQAIALGAAGYVSKEHARGDVVRAALAVLAGQRWMSPALAARVMSRGRSRRGDADGAGERGEAALTARELQVLEQLKGGRSTKEIAVALHLSERTVDLHRANIKRKLRLRTGAELIAFAISRF